jgi:hypothetical protein
MNKRSVLLMAVTVLCIFYSEISAAAKILEYRFNNPSATRAVDTSGNRLHGAFVGSDIHFEFSLAGHGYAIALNGIDDFINAGDPNLLDLRNNYTLMAWVNYRSANVPRLEIMEKGGAYWLNLRQDTKLVRAGGFFGDCNVPIERFVQIDSQTPVPEGTWTHIASTYNGKQLKIFINGQLSAQLSESRAVCVNNNPLAIGAKHVPAKGVTEAFFNGLLDDVRAYNNALSGSQIRSVMMQP